MSNYVLFLEAPRDRIAPKIHDISTKIILITYLINVREHIKGYRGVAMNNKAMINCTTKIV